MGQSSEAVSILAFLAVIIISLFVVIIVLAYLDRNRGGICPPDNSLRYTKDNVPDYTWNVQRGFRPAGEDGDAKGAGTES